VNIPPAKSAGLSPDALFEAVVVSAEDWPERPYSLRDLWTCFVELVNEGRLAFDAAAVARLHALLAEDGWPERHHSPEYKIGEMPAYRVVLKKHVDALLDRRPDIDSNVLSVFLAEHYDERLRDVHTQRRYMGVVAYLRTDLGKRIFKMYGRNLDDPGKVEARHELMNHIVSEDLPAPRVICARSGRTLLEFEGTHAALLQFLEGGTFSPGNFAQLKSAGEVLARTHLAAARWPRLDKLDWESFETMTVNTIRKRLAQVKERSPSAGRDPIGPGKLDELFSRLDALSARLDPAGLHRTAIHGDYRAQNLLFRDNTVSGILDFDFAWPAASIHDLAYAIVFFQSVVAPHPLSMPGIEAFIKGYTAARPLAPDEIERLPAFLELAFLRGMSLWLQIYFVDGMRGRSRAWIANYLDFPRRLERHIHDIRKVCA